MTGQELLVPTVWYIGLSAVLFTLGALGVLMRRTAILLFMSVELMLTSANLALAAFSRAYGVLEGQIIVFFVMTVAAAEVAIGLALLVAIFKTKGTVNVDSVHELKG